LPQLQYQGTKSPADHRTKQLSLLRFVRIRH
jgi:hypothetical protein